MSSPDQETPSEKQPWHLFPRLNREERKAMVQALEEQSQWGLNFGMLMGCSVLIAGLGLLQSSAAVVIGGMLVAPLMTPLIAIGASLVQGNLSLFATAARSLIMGVIIAIVVGLALQMITLSHDLSPEILARGKPNVLDLFIALGAGVAGAFAFVRPNVSGALPGVAIAVALVPPLASCGLALGAGSYYVALGAGVLFLTNVIAIVVASSAIFLAHGIGLSRSGKELHVALFRIVMTTLCVGVLLTGSLTWRFIVDRQKGQDFVLAYQLRPVIVSQLFDYLDTVPDADLMFAARGSGTGRLDVVLYVAMDGPVKESVRIKLEEIIKNTMGQSTRIAIFFIQEADIVPSPPPPIEKS